MGRFQCQSSKMYVVVSTDGALIPSFPLLHNDAGWTQRKQTSVAPNTTGGMNPRATLRESWDPLVNLLLPAEGIKSMFN